MGKEWALSGQGKDKYIKRHGKGKAWARNEQGKARKGQGKSKSSGMDLGLQDGKR